MMSHREKVKAALMFCQEYHCSIQLFMDRLEYIYGFKFFHKQMERCNDMEDVRIVVKLLCGE